ncbi:hypothetical protein [Nonomuraea sp. NPDC050786]|uniref:hypothetical protein n=1 Tax=Nonomuraea sp. NPDC050786 TaxID=3154840 RepID=UPI0033C157B8
MQTSHLPTISTIQTDRLPETEDEDEAEADAEADADVDVDVDVDEAAAADERAEESARKAAAVRQAALTAAEQAYLDR